MLKDAHKDGFDMQNTLECNNGVGSARKSSRAKKAPERYQANYCALVVDISDMEPNSFEDACKNEVWQGAMQEEIDSIQKNKVWDLVDLSEGKKVIGSRCLYKIKHNATERWRSTRQGLLPKGSVKRKV